MLEQLLQDGFNQTQVIVTQLTPVQLFQGFGGLVTLAMAFTTHDCYSGHARTSGQGWAAVTVLMGIATLSLPWIFQG